MKTKTLNTQSLSDRLAALPRTLELINHKGTRYLGPCVVQARQSWTRVGPCWLVPDTGWLVIGPGARSWGTTQGLAELAAADTATPEWHAAGIAIVEDPSIVFLVEPAALNSPHMAPVRALAEQAEEFTQS